MNGCVFFQFAVNCYFQRLKFDIVTLYRLVRD